VAATEQFCVPYVVDGVTVDDLIQRSEITAWTQSVHGQEVVRYRFNTLPGLLDATITQNGSCWIRTQEVPPNEMPVVVDVFSANLRLDGYRTGSANFIPDASTLVVGEPSDAAERRSHHTCVYGRTNALVQMSGSGIVHVDSGRPASQSCHLT
jgi:hypothetical protein